MFSYLSIFTCVLPVENHLIVMFLCVHTTCVFLEKRARCYMSAPLVADIEDLTCVLMFYLFIKRVLEKV